MGVTAGTPPISNVAHPDLDLEREWPCMPMLIGKHDVPAVSRRRRRRPRTALAGGGRGHGGAHHARRLAAVVCIRARHTPHSPGRRRVCRASCEKKKENIKGKKPVSPPPPLLLAPLPSRIVERAHTFREASNSRSDVTIGQRCISGGGLGHLGFRSLVVHLVKHKRTRPAPSPMGPREVNQLGFGTWR